MLISWLYAVVLGSAVVTVMAINRPVYKIVLTQKGYAQFVQYDIETPPLREFTFCSWYRMYDVNSDQTLFTYVKNGNNRILRLWLDTKKFNINFSISERVTSSAPITITKDVWRHVCVSYQSDYGAWAIYVDSRLITCQASQSISGYILPGGGSVIIGYGTDVNGAQNGFEGEVFGANMILRSTIERNYTLRTNPMFEQKSFNKNKLKHSGKNMNYIVLSDLITDEINNNFETTDIPLSTTITDDLSRLNPPRRLLDNRLGFGLKNTSTTASPIPSNEKDFFNFFVTDKYNTNLQSQAETLPNLPEYEVPPPPPSYRMLDRLTKELGVNMLPISESMPIYEVNESSTECKTCAIEKKYTDELYEIEMPPPEEKNPKVYGQWTSSKFAGNVFDYLKSMNLRTREQKKVIPQTIPLNKISDSFPYPSDFKAVKLLKPLKEFKRRNLVEKQAFDVKKMPQINLQILEDGFRSNILKYHSESMPKDVEITNRGNTKTRKEKRSSRMVKKPQMNHESYESNEYTYRPRPLRKTRKPMADGNLHVMTILPFLKSIEYYTGDSHETESPLKEKKVSKDNDIYTRSLSLGNKWHNVKSYSNDYTPREMKVGFGDGQRNMDEKIAEANKKNPGIRLRYRHKDRKVVKKDDESILKGRELAMGVSNQSNSNRDSVSIFKFNHGFLPDRNVKLSVKDFGSQKNYNTKTNEKNHFHRHVKIGNALNERGVIGDNVEQNKRNFVGGDERIPDIIKYKSQTDNSKRNTLRPGALGPRICKNLELYDRVLYVQPDESIDMSHIMSPVRMKNIGIEFIMQNYKKCTLQESNLQSNAMLFIDWNTTPVRLFGGAFPRKTTDLCGFF